MRNHTQTGSVRELNQPINPSQAEFDRLISRSTSSGKTSHDPKHSIFTKDMEIVVHSSNGR
ncbi:MAG: hypothetical protein VB032_08570 [Burkholderiaceae bacterium]|nr:hypothetical protein [Burkholderiaceae bacterium]